MEQAFNPHIVNNTLSVDGQGNIVVQGNKESVTINMNQPDPDLAEKLAKLGTTLEAVFRMGLNDRGELLDKMDQLMAIYPLPENMPVLLAKGSKAFFERLMGKFGRYGTLKMSAHILGFMVKSLGEDMGEENGPYKPETTLAHYWQSQKSTNILLKGHEGSGKTVSFLWLWKHYLLGENPNTIPIYISLNEYNRASKEEQREFILQYIAKNYLGVHRLENSMGTALKAWIESTPSQRTSPKILLLLDGLNEITGDITPLLSDLKEYWVPESLSRGIQIVVSSRYDSNHIFSSNFKAFHTQPLSEYCIKTFLDEHEVLKEHPGKISYPTNKKNLDELLRSPMMLDMYVQVKMEELGLLGEENHKINYDLTSFKRPVLTTPELIWNFIETKIARFESENDNQELRTRGHFLVQYLIPYIAFEMERENLTEIEEDKLEGIVNAAFQRFSTEGFFNRFSYRRAIKRYRKFIGAFDIGKLSVIREIARFEELLEEFAHELYPIAKEGFSLRFLHHSFQEFFAAKHLLNEIHFSLERQELPPVLKEGILPHNLHKTLGEMTEDYLPLTKNPEGRTGKRTVLMDVWELCRGIVDRNQLGYTVWNILSIWKAARGSLDGIDFSHIHTSEFNFNGEDLEACIWDYSYLAPKQIFPQGHRKEINKVRVSPCGSFLASAGKDQLAKIWSTKAFMHLQTFGGEHGHQAQIWSMTFSPDSQRLLTGGKDCKLIEWDIGTGACRQVFRGHRAPIRGLMYHSTGDRVYSVCEESITEDGTMEEGILCEWSLKHGKCMFSLSLPDSGGLTALSRIAKGNDMLVGSQRGNIYRIGGEGRILRDIFDPQDPTLPMTLAGTDDQGEIVEMELELGGSHVLALDSSPCGNKFVALSIQELVDPASSSSFYRWRIQEWSFLEKKVIQTFEFAEEIEPEVNRNAKMVDIAYHPSGESLLLAGLDDNLYEWAVLGPDALMKNQKASSTGPVQVLPPAQMPTQSYVGHVRRASSVACMPHENIFYSGSYDGSLIRWSQATGQVLTQFPPSISPYNRILKVPGEAQYFAFSENERLHKWNLSQAKLSREDNKPISLTVYSAAYFQGENEPLIMMVGERGWIQSMKPDGEIVRRFQTGRSFLDIFRENSEESSLSAQRTLTSVDVNEELGIFFTGDMKGNLIYGNVNLQRSSIKMLPFSELVGSSDAITKIVQSPIEEDHRVAICTRRGKILVLELREGKLHPIGSPMIHNEESGAYVYAMDFNGEQLLTGGTDGVVKEWDLETSIGNPIWKSSDPDTLTVLTYNSDSQRILLSTRSNPYLHELSFQMDSGRNIEQKETKVFKGHTDYILDAIYDDEEKYIITIGQDGQMIKWDRESEEAVLAITNVPGVRVKGLDFREVFWTEPLTDSQYASLHLYAAKV